ncbi:MAG: TetR family transcriptional regulator [Burkholderiales bacterium]|nr:TetR family transcriptional regulator [Burkholderiales bacterium]
MKAQPPKPRPAPPSKREQAKETIIQGAVQALVDGGPSASTRSIASAAGVNLATLHYYFENKDALLMGAFEAINLELREAAQSGLQPQESFDSSIEHVLVNAWKMVLETLDKQIVQYELAMYAARKKSDFALARWQYEEYFKVYTDVFARAFEGMPEARGLDLDAMARFIVAGMDGLILQHLADPDVHRSWVGVRRLVYATQALASARRAAATPEPERGVFFRAP